MAWDPFALLGLPRVFSLDRATIERAYLQRVGEAHPDVSIGSGDEPDQGSAEVNRARQDLSDPETRGNILLGLLGGPTKEADRSLPDGFLMEMIEVREQVEAARAVGNRADVDKWEAWADEERGRHLAAAGALFGQVGASGPSPEKLKQIRTRLNAWRYIERMLESVREGGAGGG